MQLPTTLLLAAGVAFLPVCAAQNDDVTPDGIARFSEEGGGDDDTRFAVDYNCKYAATVEEALERAAGNDALVVLLFSGEASAHKHAPVREELLDSREFEDYAKNRFVFVDYNAMRDGARSQEAIATAKEMKKKHRVVITPSFLFLDEKGVPFMWCSSGYSEYYSHEISLNNLKERMDNALAARDALRAANKQEGVERAKALMEVFCRTSKPPRLTETLSALQAEILACDPEDVTGMKHRMEVAKQVVDFRAEVKNTPNDKQKLMELSIDQEKRAFPENKRVPAERKILITLAFATSMEDMQEAKRRVIEYLQNYPVEEREGKLNWPWYQDLIYKPKDLLERIKSGKMHILM